MKQLLTLLLLGFCTCVAAQKGSICGTVLEENGEALPFATVALEPGKQGVFTDSTGVFHFAGLAEGSYTLRISSLGYEAVVRRISVPADGVGDTLAVTLREQASSLESIVVTGTMKAVSRTNSPVPVEVYTARHFRSNPAPSVFESLGNVNGVRPQLNCNVCNTGDIHINGLEGPYTMVLIDGMPIVSGLSTVYGLTGIPRSLIERMEVVKGPASTLYGSEAVGGLINIITVDPGSAPRLATDVMTTSWGEVNTDLGLSFRAGNDARGLLGVNYFNYQQPRDRNGDGFTDLTLQNRISVFNKWQFKRKDDRTFSLAGRYVYEDRWGGELNFSPAFRGGEEVYGESITTRRWEAFGTYQLPIPPRVNFQFSANGHDHDSAYGSTIYLGKQFVGFGQLTWTEEVGAHHELLAGATYRYVSYDDNTPATADESGNAPAIQQLPGVFVQDEIKVSPQTILLLGMRYDHDRRHGDIFTPRANLKWASADLKHTVRLSVGNGYRVANVFTEDHAALTGARRTVFASELEPERSWNTNLNYVRKIYDWGSGIVSLDASAFYTRFSNRILPDYLTDPNLIIYDNLDGHSVSRGGSLNVDLSYPSGVNVNVGMTAQDVFTVEAGEKMRQLLTEGASAVWTITVPWKRPGLTVDYTGNVYGPMELPLLGPLDDRAAASPWFSIQNLQLTKSWKSGVELYGGVKNLLNFRPAANSIARSFDPFDNGVEFDGAGQVVPTAGNPNALTFDPSYVYASNQGRYTFLGLRYTLR